MLAMELIPAIRRQLEELDEAGSDPVLSGRRAALWRVQQHAARVEHSIDDLRRYCLESLDPRRFVEEDDYRRGYREGLQSILREIRRVETEGRGRSS